MISFISGSFFTEEPCCKFMLKHEIQIFCRQFMKTLIIYFQQNITHTDLVMCSYV